MLEINLDKVQEDQEHGASLLDSQLINVEGLSARSSQLKKDGVEQLQIKDKSLVLSHFTPISFQSNAINESNKTLFKKLEKEDKDEAMNTNRSHR